MWIVAVAWIYVVALMAATEPTIVHGLMTFLFYCVVPLSIVLYLAGGKRRRARRAAQARSQPAANRPASDDNVPVLAAAGMFGSDFLADEGDGGDRGCSSSGDTAADGGAGGSCDGGGGGGD